MVNRRLIHSSFSVSFNLREYLASDIAPTPTMGTTDSDTMQSFGEVQYSKSEPFRAEFSDRSPAAILSVNTSAESATSNFRM